MLVPFPAYRAFGPLSWRAVRLASVVMVLLLLGGTLLDLFLGRAAREERSAPPGEARVPS